MRIAWSVWWGIVAVLLIALWVRSYWCADCFGFSPTLGIATANADIIIVREISGQFIVNTVAQGYHNEPPQPTDEIMWSNNSALQKWTLSCVREFDTFGIHMVGIRIYAIIIPVLAIGAFSWIPFRWHFGLRTLLVTTTLFAALLGLAVWAAAK